MALQAAASRGAVAGRHRGPGRGCRPPGLRPRFRAGRMSGVSAVDGWRVPQAEPEHAVPAGRVGYDLDAGCLLLHTVQPAAALDVLHATGVLRGDPQLADADFADSYEWMYRRVARRVPTSREGALWLWARTRRE